MDGEEEKTEETQYVKVIWKNPNPLFVKWITKWMEEARKRNMKLQFTLEKALESLKKFPIPLKSGKECLILEHFGTGLCEKLDRELAKYNAAKLNTAAKPAPPAAIPGPSTSGLNRLLVKEPLQKQFKEENEIVPRTVTVLNDDKQSPNKLSQIGKSCPMKSIGIVKPSPKESFENDKPSPKTLLGIDKPSPKKLFENYKPSPCDKPISIKNIKTLLGMDKPSPKKIFLSDIPSTRNFFEIDKPYSSTVQSTSGETTTTSSLKLAAHTSSAINFTKQNVEKKAYKFLADMEFADNVATTSLEDSAVNSRKQNTRSPAKRKYAEDSPQKSAFSPRKASVSGFVSGIRSSTCVETLNFETKKQIIETSPAKRKLAVPSPKKSPLKPNQPANPQLFADDNDSAPLSQLSSIGSCSQTPEEAFTFMPQFQSNIGIKLLVDTAETASHTAKRSRREEEATAYLTELGVPFEVRHLTVGDFVWVCHDESGSSKELLLPYIVERKRADDLAKSIKDGRFREQKFRLKQLPIAERIYLVEKLKKKDRPGLPFSTLMQAATNTQVIDGFKVKFTKNLKHSMQYLATMTEFLTETFRKKILMSCPKDELPPFNIKDDVSRLMTFKDFSRDTAKKRKYTVGEMFLKHLLQLRGMSVEKAKAVVNQYPTPSHLMEAYRDYNLPADRRMMLAKLKIGAVGRSLGPVLSVAIHDFYTKNEFD